MKYRHPKAFYRDESGTWNEIKREHLDDPFILAKARSFPLYDETKEYRLYPRAREGSPHFYCRAKNPRRLVTTEESDSRHKQRMAELLDKLLTLPELKIGYREFITTRDWEFVEVAEIEGYVWQTEVTRIVPNGLLVRHDVFGASPLLAMSERRPWVAIEVIATHYPEEETFQSLLNLSAHLPVVVAFDLVDAWNYFVQLDCVARTLRFIYYIYDGAVWKNDQRTRIQDAAALKAVLQFELRDLRRRGRAA